MLILYPVGRFLMEFVRQDEAGLFLGFTFSQLISFGVVVAGFALFALAKDQFQQVADEQPAF